MKRNLLWAIIAVSLVLVLSLLYVVIAQPIEHAHSLSRLRAAEVNVQNASDQFDAYLNKDFTRPTPTLPKTSCSISSPPFSLMHDGSCAVTNKLDYVGKTKLTDEQVQQDVTAIINGLHAGETYSFNDPGAYVQSMQTGGTWRYGIYIPGTGIKGMPQTNKAGATNIADVYADLSAQYLPGTHTTSLSVTVGQTYATCRGAFIPCDYYIAK